MDLGAPLLPTSVTSDRLVLRQWSESEADALGAAINASVDELIPWMPWASFEPLSQADRVNLIKQWRLDHQSQGSSILGAFRDEVVVGSCGLHNRIGPTSLEIGYWVHTAHTGNGYATEIAEALTSAAFNWEHIESVEIRCDKANTRSAAIPKRLGFVLAGSFDDAIRAPGETGIECQYQMLRSDWTPRPTDQQP